MLTMTRHVRIRARATRCWLQVGLLLWLLGLPAVATAANVIRGPYVQNGTPTSIVLCWRTDVATNSRVSVGTVAGTLTTQVNSAALVTDHEITVSGLTANTRYYYSVGSSTSVLAGGTTQHFFVTNPAPGVGKPTRFWIIGDAGTGDANQAAVRDAYYAYTGVRHTDGWLQLGDNAYQEGSDAEYQANVFEVYHDLLQKSVTWPTRGNHETTANTAVYYGSFAMPKTGEAGGVASGSEAYYSFNYGRIHFICLDSVISSRAVGDPMLTWLTADLAANNLDWTIAFWHHPPYSKGTHDSDTDATQTDMRVNALPILEAGGVDLVLSGHSHIYERSFFIDSHYGISSTFTNAMKVQAGDGKVGGNGPYEKSAITPQSHAGAVYVVCGSSGKVSGGPQDHPAMYLEISSLASMVLDVNGNHLDATTLNESGAVLDHFRIIKGGSGLDSTAPVFVAAGAVNLTRVDAVFSEKVTAATANTLGNYTLTGPTGSVAIAAAALQADGMTVRLTVASLTAGATYSLSVAGVKDPSNNTAPTLAISFVAPGAAGPAITTQPADASVTLSATATFSVVAPGATNYQWKKNGTNIPGATSSSYTTPAVTALDNGTQFTVAVSNATGTTLSNIATLTVNSGGAPITVVMQDGTASYAGTRDTYLDAIAPTVNNGTEDRINVNWASSGTTENTIGLLKFDMSAIPTTATITSATIDLWLIRTNGVGSTDLLIIERVTGDWTESSTYAGGVPTAVASGVTAPSLGSVPNASPLSPPYQYAITGIETMVQGWAAAPATNKGIKLTCTSNINLRFASREHSTVAIHPRLTVTYTTGSGSPPSITTQPLNQTVTEPATATFSVVASGATGYQWQKNTVDIPGATSSSYTTPPTTTADSGATFRVKVTNASGTTTSSSATLTVNPAAGTPPVITAQPTNKTVTAPATATFTVTATGATGYQWQKNTVDIPGATSSSYTTPATTTADSGATFRVKVANASGTTISSSATLTVNPAPGGSNPITPATTIVTLTATTGSSTPVTTTLTLTNTSSSAILVTPSSVAPWLTLSGPVSVPANGTAAVALIVNPTGQPTGTQTGTLTLTNSTGGTQTVSVQFTVGMQTALRKRACSIATQSDPSLALVGLLLLIGCWLARRIASVKL